MLIIRSTMMTEFERNFYTLPKIGAILMATFTVTNTNDSGAGSLRQAITSADASTGKNIINFCGLFDDGLAHTISLTGGGLSITDDIIILGRNPNLLTISDDSASRVFDITSGATATINGLTITNTYNSAVGGGGISNEGVLTLNNSIITGNTVYGNSTDSNGGGINNSGSLTVNHSTISNNTVTDGLTLSDPSKYHAGGGIYSTGNLTVNYSNITGNTVGLFSTGGGIYNSNGIVTVNYSNISGNSAGFYGGGISNSGSNGGSNGGSLTVNYSNISENKASNYSYGGGGGISNGGSLTVNYSNISGNSAGEGGGIDNGASLTVNYSNISGNSAGEGGGISTVSTLLSTVNYSNIIGNSAEGGGGISNSATDGGAGSNNHENFILNYSNISGNSAEEGAGGISNYEGTLTVRNCTITENTVSQDTGEGGGIANSGYTFGNIGIANVSVIDSTISGNTAGYDGGGIWNDANFSVSYSNVHDNQSGYDGGGIYNEGTLTVNHSSISGNQANRGGGISNNGGTLTVSNSAIEYNKALVFELLDGTYVPGQGGGIFNNIGATINVSDSSISDNTAGIGGGIYNYGLPRSSLGVFTVSDSTIADNQAQFGGGIYNEGTLTVCNSAIEYNKAFGIINSGSYESGDGGGIYNNSTYGGTTTVDYSAIAFNFDTCQEYSNNFIRPDDIAGNFINNGYNWIGATTSTTAAGDVV